MEKSFLMYWHNNRSEDPRWYSFPRVDKPRIAGWDLAGFVWDLAESGWGWDLAEPRWDLTDLDEIL